MKQDTCCRLGDSVNPVNAVWSRFLACRAAQRVEILVVCGSKAAGCLCMAMTYPQYTSKHMHRKDRHNDLDLLLLPGLPRSIAKLGSWMAWAGREWAWGRTEGGSGEGMGKTSWKWATEAWAGWLASLRTRREGSTTQPLTWQTSNVYWKQRRESILFLGQCTEDTSSLLNMNSLGFFIWNKKKI